jgi:hypothetical protein
MRTAMTVGLDSVTLGLGHVYQKLQNLTNLLHFICTDSFPHANLTHESVCFVVAGCIAKHMGSVQNVQHNH